MRTPARLIAGLLLAAVPACARAPAPQGATPVPALTDGATDWFGPGVTAVRGDARDRIRVRLDRPAQVIVLHLMENGPVQLGAITRLDAGTTWLTVPAQLIAGARQTVPMRPPPTDPYRVDEYARRECETRQRANEERRSPERASTTPPVAAMGSCAMMIRSARISVPAMSPERPALPPRGRVPDFILLVMSDSVVTLDEIRRRLGAVRVFDLETVTHDLPEYLVGRRTPMWAGYLVPR